LNDNVPELDGISHIDLSVTDVERSLPFYTDVLGFEVLGREESAERTMVLMTHAGLANGVCLNEHRDGGDSPFDERRAGLDHLSFRVASREQLETWQRTFEAHGVSHSPIADTPFGPVLVFRDPDNIQLELMAGPGT
jgi:catechol 2,3-dioxygenase-like lactoylglutathione lyase family enzyme